MATLAHNRETSVGREIQVNAEKLKLLALAGFFMLSGLGVSSHAKAIEENGDHTIAVATPEGSDLQSVMYYTIALPDAMEKNKKEAAAQSDQARKIALALEALAAGVVGAGVVSERTRK
jgi:hypothetical protein